MVLGLSLVSLYLEGKHVPLANSLHTLQGFVEGCWVAKQECVVLAAPKRLKADQEAAIS